MSHTHKMPMPIAARRGFTLIELLVVIAIIAAIMAATVPLIGAMGNMVRGGAGISTVNVATTVARAYSVRDRAAAFDAAGQPENNNAGVAILFTPANELRLIESTPHPAIMAGRGFNDIAGRDYIKLPSSGVAYGITRNSTGLRLIAPPFAIRFDRTGHLVVNSDASGRDIVYDGNGDGTYDEAASRPTPYDSDQWNPKINPAVTRVPATRAYVLPFEDIDTVIGVVFFSGSEFDNAWAEAGEPHPPSEIVLPDPPGTLSAMAQWSIENGEFMFFSRYTGTYVRERGRR